MFDFGEKQKQSELMELTGRNVPQEVRDIVKNAGDLFETSSASFSNIFFNAWFNYFSLNGEINDESFREKIEKKEKRQIEGKDFRVLEKRAILKGLFEGRDVVDLGCGRKFSSRSVRYVAEQVGAKRYIGVDKYSIDEDFVRENDFTKIWLKDDILLALAKMEKLDNPVFVLSGIELSCTRAFLDDSCGNGDTRLIALKYKRKIIEEIVRLCGEGSSVLLIGVEEDWINFFYQAGFRKKSFKDPQGEDLFFLITILKKE